MSQTRIVGYYKAAHIANRVHRDTPRGSAPESHKHSINGYRSGKHRDCRECRALHSKATAEHRRGVNAAKIAAAKADREARLARCLQFLEDGCSYMEAAKSAGIDHHTALRNFPGYNANSVEWKSVWGSIRNNQDLLKLHREIWGNQ